MSRLFGPRQDPSLPRFATLARRRVLTPGGEVAIVDVGRGPTLLFLHGGVLASDFWRVIIPALADSYRCIAIDLPGTGASAPTEKNGDRYSLDSQTAAMAGAVDALELDTPIILVLHGWASMVGFHWASSHENQVRALAHMESIVNPLAWPNLPDRLRTHLRLARTSPAAMYSMEYVEEAMEFEVNAPLAGPVVDAYRSVWEGGHLNRQAHLAGLRQIPISGKPARAQEIVLDYQKWLQSSLFPKLLIVGRPGLLTPLQGSAHALWNQTVVGVVGCHLLAEESPEDITMFLSAWIRQRVLVPRPGAASTPE